MPSSPPDAKAPGRARSAGRYEYVSLPDCAENNPNVPGADDVMCSRALKQCPANLVGSTRLRIWQRLVSSPSPPTQWKPLGVTCYSDVAPGSKPRLTMALINEAAMRTPWAEPVVTTQPKGGVTVVNLPTFYQVRWSTQGYQPGETATTVLLGIPVKIRPKLAGPAFTYDFGDGRALGPTASLGGVYPTGAVRHAYTSTGVFDTKVTTTWTAEFSLDDGRTWDDVGTSVDVPGPSTAVSVKQARAVLVTR